jgi:uncharacterized surface protein with fasciclin (FAS1) repeats
MGRFKKFCSSIFFVNVKFIWMRLLNCKNKTKIEWGLISMKERDLMTIFLAVLLFSGLSSGQDEEAGTIVELAMTSEDLSTLATAIETAGLGEALSGDGPFTVFAPTNSAFEDLPEGILETLLNDTEALTEVLTYHVVEGRYMASDVVNLTTVPTLLAGGKLTINVTDVGVMVNDAVVVQADIEASNGVVHLIDAVLIPPFEEEMAEAMGEGQTICVSESTRELLQSLNITRFREGGIASCPVEEAIADPTCLSTTPCT